MPSQEDLFAEYVLQGGNKYTKKKIIFDIIESYNHDYQAEGNAISKRRLWYILKPQFVKAIMPVYIKGGMYYRREQISNQDYNKHYNDLSKDGIINDTYIADNSRTMGIGSLLPHIILAPEKATIKDTVIRLAEKLQCSYYISGGQSSIYGARKLLDMIDESGINSDKIIVLTMTDHDKSGHSISKNIGKHFNVEEYRTLITPEQIPEDKKEDYFDIFEDGTRAYELDVLNIHQLQDIFLNSVPDNVSDIIYESHKARAERIARENEVIDRVAEDKKILELDNKISELEEMKAELTYELEEYYYNMYDNKKPTKIQPFNLHTIVNSVLKYDIEDKWWVS